MDGCGWDQQPNIEMDIGQILLVQSCLSPYKVTGLTNLSSHYFNIKRNSLCHGAVLLHKEVHLRVAGIWCDQVHEKIHRIGVPGPENRASSTGHRFGAVRIGIH